MNDERFDPDHILRTLNRHQVRYVVIGGLAGALRGTPVITHDLDICYDRAPDNLERLAAALAELEATLRVARETDDLAFPLDARAFLLGDTFTLKTPFGALDVLGTPSGTSGYGDLALGATRYELADGLVVDVAGLDDLIRMKMASQRPKDLAQLAHLEALRDEIERARAEGIDPQQGAPST
jgi:hypothetical protein